MDDEPSFLDQAEMFLEEEDDRLDVTTATSVEKGIEILEEEDFDAIVSDYKLPEMDGIDFLEYLRDQEIDIPFIVFTGKGREEVAMESLNLGADRYLKKGGDPEVQFSILASAVIEEVEHYRTREAYFLERSLFQELLKRIPDSIYFKDRDARFVKVSENKAGEVGADSESIIGKTDFDFYPEEQAQKMYEDDMRVMEEEEPVIRKEEEITKPNGEKWWASVTKVPRYDEEGNVIGMLGISRDITDRKEAEKRVRRYRVLVDSSDDPVAAIDTDYRFLFANEAYQETFLPEADQLEGRFVEGVLGKETFDNSVKPKVDRCLNGENVRYEMSRITPKGEERHFDITYSPLEDEEGEIIGLGGIARDITGLREAQERQEFLRSLVSHDVRNKIRVSKGYLELLQESDISEDQREFVEMAMNAHKNSFRLIEKLNTFSKIGRAEITEISLSSAIGEALERNEDRAERKGIDIDYEKCECGVQADPLLPELFSNLVENSIQHSGGDELKIWAQREDDEITVVVEDDGKGIADEDKEEVFESDFKKGESGGSGLGTYLVNKIAKSSNGSVEVKDSELGGARFEVHLKRA